MKAVIFKNAATQRDFAINRWLGAGPSVGAGYTEIIIGDNAVVTVVGAFADVLAALESATAPPIAAAVEVAPADLEVAAQVLEIFARYATPEGLGVEVDHIDRALGLSDDDRSCSWETTFRTLFELAAKLRGAQR